MTDWPTRDLNEQQLCYDLLRLLNEFSERIGEHRTHELLKERTAAFGKVRLRGKRGRRLDPAKYSTDPRAVKKRKQRDWFERLINTPGDQITEPPGH
jgi:hypothetical protein